MGNVRPLNFFFGLRAIGVSRPRPAGQGEPALRLVAAGVGLDGSVRADQHERGRAADTVGDQRTASPVDRHRLGEGAVAGLAHLGTIGHLARLAELVQPRGSRPTTVLGPRQVALTLDASRLLAEIREGAAGG